MTKRTEAAQSAARARDNAPHVARKAEAARQAGKTTVTSERGESETRSRRYS